jgi:hypothetical protein
VGQATLTPGTVLADFHPAGPILLAVDAGTLALVSDDVLAMHSGGAEEWRNAGTVAAGGAAVLRPGSWVDLHNPGADSVVVTIFAILPAGAVTGGTVH